MNLLSCIKSFVFIVDNKSFSIAAKKLYASPSKLSKEIAWLENRLKTKLFNRTTRQLHLTEEGKMLYKRAQTILQEVSALQDLKYQNGNDAIEVNLNLFINTTPAIPYFTELSFEYMRMHSNVSIRLITGVEPIAIDGQKSDVTISFEKIKAKNIVCDKLFSVKRAIYASPEYLKSHPVIKSPEDLFEHNCLINTSYGLQNNWLLGDKIVQVYGNFQSNNASVIKLAAVKGHGLLWAPPFSVQQEMNNGLLVRLLEKHTSNEINLYYSHPLQTDKLKYIEDLIKFFQSRTNLENDVILD